MIYNLFLNSTTDIPLTNYYSAVLDTNRGQRVYAVDWSFLPEDTKFKVSFKFISKNASLTGANVYNIVTNFTQPNSVSGGNEMRRYTNTILGTVKPRMVTGTTDVQLIANPLNNDPIVLNERPSNNLLEIKVLDFANAQYNSPLDYLMIISFQEMKN